MRCPLCLKHELSTFSPVNLKALLYRCLGCDLVFKDPGLGLSFEDQKSRYDLHNNNPSDEGYRQFLNKFLNPLLPHLPGGARVLDWGSGPTPALSQMVRDQGYSCEIYDPIYQPQMPEGRFEAVISTEVVEHLRDPRESFLNMKDKVNQGGILAGMTEYHHERTDLLNWWYAKDPTHICFYSEKTIQFLAKFLNAQILWNEKNVFILKL